MTTPPIERSRKRSRLLIDAAAGVAGGFVVFLVVAFAGLAIYEQVDPPTDELAASAKHDADLSRCGGAILPGIVVAPRPGGVPVLKNLTTVPRSSDAYCATRSPE